MQIVLRDMCTVLEGWTTVRRYLVENGAGGAFHTRDVVHRPDIAAVLPFSSGHGTITLVSQTRLAVHLAGCGDSFLEAPSGRIDPGECASAAAARELREETGWTANGLDAVGRVFLHPALSTERAHLFLCNLDRISAPRAIPDGGDVLGVLGVAEVAFAEAIAMCASGAIADAKTALLIGLLAARMPERFCERSAA